MALSTIQLEPDNDSIVTNETKADLPATQYLSHSNIRTHYYELCTRCIVPLGLAALTSLALLHTIA